MAETRNLSLPKTVAAKGGIKKWNEQTDERKALLDLLLQLCQPKNSDEALLQVKSMLALDHQLWGYMYMRMLQDKSFDLYYDVMLKEPDKLLPMMYTPTVGEACQKFGKLPFFRRGCYVAITDRGNIKEVLKEYAEAELYKNAEGKFMCDCIVFSDGGRILGLGDLGTWGMGIPIGKLDLYTVCGGVNPYRTMPVIIDAGCHDADHNTAKLVIRDHELYTGLKQERECVKSEAGTIVNEAYYGEDSMINEFMSAATDLFGTGCLLQFEDFNSNDAFPLLAHFRTKYLSYNDDIQGTAAVTVAAIMGGIKLKNPSCKDIIGALANETFLFHGAGSANLGAISLLHKEGKVPLKRLHITNSRGLIYVAEDGKHGNFRNDEQKEFAHQGEPKFQHTDLIDMVKNLKPHCLVGAVGVAPNCFTKEIVEAMVQANGEYCGMEESHDKGERPIIFALSNPKTQAEITATNAYTWSEGKVIFGSGTYFDPVTVKGVRHAPGQVNNVFIFPGVSFGAVMCHASTIPDRLFLVAAAAVANSLDSADMKADRVVPARARVREVSLNVATAVVLECQKLGLAGKKLGETEDEVKSALNSLMWVPGMPAHAGPRW